jgi:LytS/YehU family sensor histidine kinase
LQPLVENAVTHGIANLLDGGIISLTARATSQHLTIIVENTCDLDATVIRRGGRGLANVRNRLEARYAKEADMRVAADAGTFKVQLTLPLEIAPVPASTESFAEEQKTR